MALVLADVGAGIILNAFFNNSWAAGGKNLTLKLFVTDVTPAQNSTAGSFTEASGGGYSSKTLSNGSWTVNAAGDPPVASYAQQTWTFTGPLTTNGTVYGYYIVDADGTLLYAEKFSQSFTPANNGDQILLTPRFELSSGTPT